jgi:hypothetical protein
VGHVKSSDRLRDGTRESAFFVAEQFALKQRSGNRCAVDREKWLVVPWAVIVNCPRDYFFSSTRFSLDEYATIKRATMPISSITLRQRLLERIRFFWIIDAILSIQSKSQMKVPTALRATFFVDLASNRCTGL